VIANLTLKGLPQGKGMPLCWDNVLYGAASVGYINANHQDLGGGSEKVISCYLPLVSDDPDSTRRQMHRQSFGYWLRRFVDELSAAHGDIGRYITHADIWIWGHGMIAPAPGLMNSDQLRRAAAPVNDQLFFAHTDLSGISIFEEAFYQGIRAADEVLKTL
jgi:hypothetical protein